KRPPGQGATHGRARLFAPCHPWCAALSLRLPVFRTNPDTERGLVRLAARQPAPDGSSSAILRGRSERSPRVAMNALLMDYLPVILFIVFDIEFNLLIPYALAREQLGDFGFWAFILFLAILTVGFIYEWKKGA